MTYRKRKLRIHFTNGQRYGSNKHHKVCYCGESYDTFTGPYQHTVYTLYALKSGKFQLEDKDLCSKCISSPDLAIELLRGLDD